jgi:hypothetical protein
MPQNLGQITGEKWGFLVPDPWLWTNIHGQGELKTKGLILYSGTTFVLFFCILLGCGLFYKFGRKDLGLNVWALCALLGAQAIYGASGIVWPVMMHVPLLSKFRVPGKFLAFFDIFAALLGSIVLERLLRRIRWSNQIAFGAVITTAVLVGASCMMPLTTWYIYHVKPYPAAESILQQIPDASSRKQRIFSLSLMRSSSSRYWEGMPHNLPTVYKIPALFGYDPLVDDLPSFLKVKAELNTQFLQSLREYGAEYVLLPNDFDHPELSLQDPELWVTESESPVARHQISQVVASGETIFRSDAISILRLSAVKPLAYVEKASSTSLPLEMNAQGFDIDTTTLGRDRRVIANFLWYPEMQAKGDGKRLEVGSDSWQRMAFDVPTGVKKVRVRFVPEWGKGLICATVAALVGIGCGFVALRFNSPAAGAKTVSP